MGKLRTEANLKDVLLEQKTKAAACEEGQLGGHVLTRTDTHRASFTCAVS